MANSVHPDETAHYEIWICAVCKGYLYKSAGMKRLKYIHMRNDAYIFT